MTGNVAHVERKTVGLSWRTHFSEHLATTTATDGSLVRLCTDGGAGTSQADGHADEDLLPQPGHTWNLSDSSTSLNISHVKPACAVPANAAVWTTEESSARRAARQRLPPPAAVFNDHSAPDAAGASRARGTASGRVFLEWRRRVCRSSVTLDRATTVWCFIDSAYRPAGAFGGRLRCANWYS
jgi:hypothetical protein